MEILGIVWAASIITPSSVLAATTNTVERQTLQDPIHLEETASWFNSLASIYGWSTSAIDRGSAYTNAALSTSWLATNLSPTELNDEHRDDADESFTSLVPSIGVGLIDLAESLMSSSSESTSPLLDHEALTVDDWHNWNAIASVQLENKGVQKPAPSTETLALDSVCLRDTSAPYQASPLATTTAAKTQIWVHNHFIGDVASQVTANRIAKGLRSLIQQGTLEPAQIHPLIGSDFVGIRHQDDVLLVVDETLRSHPEVPATLIAVQWINNLRQAFDEQPLELAEIQMAIKGLAKTSDTFYGTASWYGPGFHGRKTANGETFDENSLTAAHKSLPFNTHLKVTNRLNGKSVVVRINDRGPYIGQRSLDLSRVAAHCLGSTLSGVIPYEAVMLTPTEQPEFDDLKTAYLSLDD